MIMVVQFAIPLILLVGVWFMPKSPRWLLQKHPDDEALRALTSIRTGSAESEAVQAKFDLIKAAMREEQQMHAASQWRDVFVGPNPRRTMIATGVQIFQQIQGNSLMNNYLVVFLQQIGITNSWVTTLPATALSREASRCHSYCSTASDDCLCCASAPSLWRSCTLLPDWLPIHWEEFTDQVLKAVMGPFYSSKPLQLEPGGHVPEQPRRRPRHSSSARK
ncbi:hypothetical protein BJX99DRAFT_166979 [Aspergillus californicus]